MSIKNTIKEIFDKERPRTVVFIILSGLLFIFVLHVIGPCVLATLFILGFIQLPGFLEIKNLLDLFSLPTGFWWTWGIVTVIYCGGKLICCEDINKFIQYRDKIKLDLERIRAKKE